MRAKWVDFENLQRLCVDELGVVVIPSGDKMCPVLGHLQVEDRPLVYLRLVFQLASLRDASHPKLNNGHQ
jgi:hypothetical protein